MYLETRSNRQLNFLQLSIDFSVCVEGLDTQAKSKQKLIAYIRDQEIGIDYIPDFKKCSSFCVHLGSGDIYCLNDLVKWKMKAVVTVVVVAVASRSTKSQI